MKSADYDIAMRQAMAKAAKEQAFAQLRASSPLYAAPAELGVIALVVAVLFIAIQVFL